MHTKLYLKEVDYFNDLDIDGRMMLKHILKKRLDFPHNSFGTR
jgi:hypothetical protein